MSLPFSFRFAPQRTRQQGADRLVEVVKTAYPDPTDKDGKAVAVDIKAVQPVKQPVTLAAIKADPKFKDFKLVRQSRLSVVPVSDEHWKLLLKMSDTK